MPAAVVEHAGDHLGADERLVAERDDRGLDLAERGDAGLQRGGLAVGPAVADDDVGAAEVDLLADGVGVGAEDDHDRVEIDGTASIARTACSSSGRPSSTATCLAPPKRLPSPAASTMPPISGSVSAARRRAGHAGTPSSISSASASRDASELPGMRWSTCGSAACMPRVSGS